VRLILPNFRLIIPVAAQGTYDVLTLLLLRPVTKGGIRTFASVQKYLSPWKNVLDIV